MQLYYLDPWTSFLSIFPFYRSCAPTTCCNRPRDIAYQCRVTYTYLDKFTSSHPQPRLQVRPVVDRTPKLLLYQLCVPDEKFACAVGANAMTSYSTFSDGSASGSHAGAMARCVVLVLLLLFPCAGWIGIRNCTRANALDRSEGGKNFSTVLMRPVYILRCSV